MPTRYGKEETRDRLLAFMAKQGVDSETILNQEEFYSYFLNSLPAEERELFYGRLRGFPDLIDHGGGAYFFGKRKTKGELSAMGKRPWTLNSSVIVKYGVAETRSKLEEYAEEQGLDLLEVKNRSQFYEEDFLKSFSENERKLFHCRIRSIPGCSSSDQLFGGMRKEKYNQAETVERIWRAINEGAEIRDHLSYRNWRETLSVEEKDKLLYNPCISFSVLDFFAQFRQGKLFYGLDEHIALIGSSKIESLEQYQQMIEAENERSIKKYHFDPEKVFSFEFFASHDQEDSFVGLGDLPEKYLRSRLLLAEAISLNEEIGRALEEALLKAEKERFELGELRQANRLLRLESAKNAESLIKWKALAEKAKTEAEKYQEIRRRVLLRKNTGANDQASEPKVAVKEPHLSYFSQEYTRALRSRMGMNRNFICFKEEYYYVEAEIVLFISRNKIGNMDEYLGLREKLPEKARRFYPSDLEIVYGKKFFS